MTAIPRPLSADPSFRLDAPLVGEPLAAAIQEGADAPAGPTTPYRMNPGDTFSGNIGFAGDSDWIAVRLVAGQSYVIEMDGVTLSDTYLELYDANGNRIGYNDDAGSYDHSQIEYTATQTGIYYISAKAFSTYTGTSYQVSLGVQPPYTMQQIADYLTEGFWADRGEGPRSYDVGQGGVLTVDMTDLSAAEQQVARMALNAWSEVTGIRFNTSSTAGEAANIHMVNDDARGAYSAPTAGSGSTVTSSIVNIPVNWAEGPAGGFASYFYQTYIHEIGHALGLGHAGNYNGGATYGVDNHYPNDSWQATVMSYFDQIDNTAVHASRAFVMTPMIADIIAIQDLYGTPANLNGGNSVWGVNANVSSAFRLACQLMTSGKDVTLTIFDQGGVDWLRLGNDTSAQLINLAAGGISNVYGLVGNLSIARGTVIEHVVAGQGNDRIWGNAAGNWLFAGNGNDICNGGAGNDTLEGGAGADRLVGGLGNDLFIIDARDTVVEAVNGGIDKVRALFAYTLGANLEALLVGGTVKYGTGNSVANTIVGNGAANYLSGGAGNDTIFGMAGDDTLAGNAGADRLVGGAGNDTYFRDAYDTIVESTAQGGYDTVITSRDIVLGANLEKVVVTGDRAVNVTGNELDNVIMGNGADNVLNGGGGEDVLFGGGGRDAFVFAAGQDGRIGDFQDDIDVIRIDRATAGGATAAQLLAEASQTAEGVTLTVGGSVIRIDGITIDALQDDLIIA